MSDTDILTTGQVAMALSRAKSALNHLELFCSGVELSRDFVLEKVKDMDRDMQKMAYTIESLRPNLEVPGYRPKKT